MLESIHTHEPMLVNAIGHSVGLLLFAGFLVLVLRDRRRGAARRLLPALAAALALVWNAGSLFALAGSSGLMMLSDAVAAVSFSVLSLLPAVLLQISLEGKGRGIWMCGYAVSGVAVALHLAELVWAGDRFHQAAIWVIIAGFAPLTAVAMLTARHASPDGFRRAGPRIAGAMCLFLFAISFVHFSPGRASDAWSSEIALHHAGLPLALYVLLQDYRFLMVDAFLRFLASGLVASGFIVLTLVANARLHILALAEGNPFLEGVLLVAGCVALLALVWARGKFELLLTRVVFGRADSEAAIAAIREAGSRAESEASFLEAAGGIMARFMRTPTGEVHEVEPEAFSRMHGPFLVSPFEVLVPVRFVKGDGALLLLGRREGSRRYLSEDLNELGRMATVVVEQVERLRNSEVQRLVSQAELRALESQINPHFLFNSLNTLYGTISRESTEARRMVLNLAEILRYTLKPGRSLIPLAEEVEIVRAYLEIEKLRLGEKLQTAIDVDEEAGRVSIPVLSLQTLVENAVKHGVTARGSGMVCVRARTGSRGVEISVSDDGVGFQAASVRRKGGGLGLDNVRQRLRLCFGESARLKIDSSGQGSTVGFLVPARVAAKKVALV